MSRILVVDDQPEIRDILRTLLESEGYEVVSAEDGRAALKLQAATPADLVIVDLVMPGMNGLDMICEFRQRFGGVKIIAMSGAQHFMVDKNLESSRINGADRAFKKPFDLQQLLAAIEDLLGESVAAQS